MNRTVWSLFALFGVVLFGDVAAFLQTAHAEADGTKQLSAEQVGTYRGDGKIDVAVATEWIVKGTNRFRAENDLSAVKADAVLSEVAREFAKYMASSDRYGHQADGKTPAARIKESGYESCTFAENIAYFFHSNGYEAKPLGDRAVKAWIDSPGHRANMLKPHVTEIGAGVAQSKTTGIYYTVQIFARPQSAAIAFRIENETQQTVQYSVGKRNYSLQPRYTRTHKECVPAEVTLSASTATPQISANDILFQIRDGDAGLTLERVTSE